MSEYEFEDMLVLYFGREQYENLDGFLEHFARMPEMRKYGSFIIRPSDPDDIDFTDIEQRVMDFRIEQTSRQDFNVYDRVILQSATPVIRSQTGEEFLSEGSCRGKTADEQVVNFYIKAKKKGEEDKQLSEQYAPDQQTALTEGHEFLDMTKLAQNSALQFDPQFIKGKPINGIHNAYAYYSRANTAAGLHREDCDMGSLNVCLWSEPEAKKLWFAVGCEDAENVLNRLRSLAMEAEESLSQINKSWARQASKQTFCCQNFWRNKNVHITLEVWLEWMNKRLLDQPPVKIYLGRQQPKDLVVTLPRSWHQVYNSGNKIIAFCPELIKIVRRFDGKRGCSARSFHRLDIHRNECDSVRM